MTSLLVKCRVKLSGKFYNISSILVSSIYVTCVLITLIIHIDIIGIQDETSPGIPKLSKTKNNMFSVLHGTLICLKLKNKNFI